MATVDAIRKITIQASTPGADQATQSLNNLVAAQNRVAASADLLRASMDASQKAVNDNVEQLNQLKAANDNAAGGFGDFAKSASDVSSNLASTIESTLSTISHLKLLAVAAYAVSPAFRAIANTGVSAALGLMPPILATTASAAASLGSRLLALSAPLTIPIAAAVVGWESLNYVWTTGSGLLDKYAGSVRSFFAADVSDNLAKLTKLQPDDSISQQQIGYATELGARLATAKQTLSDFWTVEINVNDAALKLQSVWVNIVEVMASAVTSGRNLFDKLQSGALAFGNSSIWDKIKGIGAGLPGLGSLPGTIDPNKLPQPAADTSDADNMAAARKRLAAGMGGGGTTFPYARFSQGVRDLANPPAPDTSNPDQTNSYDRAIQGIKDQISQLALEADGASKTSQAIEELKVAHTANIAAMKAGIPVTDEMRAQWKSLGDQIAAYTIQVNQAKAVQEETYKSQTMFMSPGDAAAASSAHSIDPTNWQAHINDAGPAMAKLNSELSTARDLTTSFATGFVDAMMRGQSATVALRSEVASLLQSLADAATKGLINSLFAGLSGGSTGTLAGLLSPQFLKFADGGIMTADGPMPLRRYAGGGVASSPQLAMYGEGSQPEAFVPLPNGRSIPVQMGSFKGGGTVTHNINVDVNVSGARGSQEINDTVNAGVQKAIATSAAMLSSYDKGILGRVADNQQRFG